MKKIILVLLFLNCFTTFVHSEENAVEVFLRIPFFAEPYIFNYQDLIVNGKVLRTGTGGPPCEERWNMIKPVLDKYNRPFTVLEIGACCGYFCWKIAENYDATCVMMDQLGKVLLQICHENTERNNVMFMHHRVTAHQLEELANGEHFDVVICMMTLHHLPEASRVAKALLSLGDTVIIHAGGKEDWFQRTPKTYGSIDSKSAEGSLAIDYLNQNCDIIGNTYRGKPLRPCPMYLYQTKREIFTKISYEGPPLSDTSTLSLDRDNTTITLTKEKNGRTYARNWIKGISLQTFKNLNGVFPTKEMIDEELINLGIDPSTDQDLSDIIIQGKRLVKLN